MAANRTAEKTTGSKRDQDLHVRDYQHKRATMTIKATVGRIAEGQDEPWGNLSIESRGESTVLCIRCISKTLFGVHFDEGTVD